MALAVLPVGRAYDLASAQDQMSEDDLHVFSRMKGRILQSDPEMTRFRALADRWDNLYYPAGFTAGGASHWADHPSANEPGRAHVSVNAYGPYVDIPASLTSVPPVENFVASGEESEEGQQSRAMAAMAERIFTTWKDTIDFEAKGHTACIVKGLYGRTAAKVWWNDQEDYPEVRIIENPRNLRLGYASSDYQKVSWAIYEYLITPDEAEETYGLRCEVYEDSATGYSYPYVVPDASIISSRDWLAAPSDLKLNVYDYWYRAPAEGYEPELGEATTFDTWNAIFIGNALVVRKKHPEYQGRLPYVPLFNTFIPGIPDGRSDLYDIEQLIREKDERMSEAAQMMSRAINGQYWQLTGPEASETPNPNLRPLPNQVVFPGGGNRIEAITPWMPAFQVEQHLGRIDRELADVSGLSDLLRGLAPSAVLSSGKAINALVANYEARIRIKRDLYYQWRREIWVLARMLWAEKNRDIADLLNAAYRHDVQPPTLTPRDDMETATMAGNLVGARLWSAARGMDRVGVDDPEQEMDIISEEQTNATYNPTSVMTMAQLLTVLRQLQIPAPEEVQAAAGAGEQALAAERALGGTPAGQPALNAPGEQPQQPGNEGPPPTEAEMMGAAPPAPPAGGVEGDMLLQQQTPTGQEPRTRIVSQQRILGGG